MVVLELTFRKPNPNEGFFEEHVRSQILGLRSGLTAPWTRNHHPCDDLESLVLFYGFAGKEDASVYAEKLTNDRSLRRELNPADAAGYEARFLAELNPG